MIVFASLLDKTSHGKNLTRADICAALASYFHDEVSDAEITELLLELKRKGETAEELAGAVDALGAQRPFEFPEYPELLDTCGTGGDGKSTINLSTSAALIAASAGIPVAKHGNRKISSQAGSADVLAALGIPIDLDYAAAKACLAAHNFVFLFAPNYYPILQKLAPLRRAIGLPTILNLIGPLANPAPVTAQLIGASDAMKARLIAETCALLGRRQALIVSAEAGIDEIAPEGRTLLIKLHQGTLSESFIEPADFGLKPAPLASIAGGDAEQNATILEAVFNGESHPARTGIIMNGAAALVAAGRYDRFDQAAAAVIQLLDRGMVSARLAALRGFR